MDQHGHCAEQTVASSLWPRSLHLIRWRTWLQLLRLGLQPAGLSSCSCAHEHHDIHASAGQDVLQLCSAMADGWTGWECAATGCDHHALLLALFRAHWGHQEGLILHNKSTNLNKNSGLPVCNRSVNLCGLPEMCTYAKVLQLLVRLPRRQQPVPIREWAHQGAAGLSPCGKWLLNQ